MEEEVKKPKTKSVVQIVAIIVAALLILAGIGGTYYFYRQYNKAKALLSDPNAVDKAESEVILGKIKKLMILPSNENPSIATVLDAGKLKDQPFFANAENGDKVVIYTKSQIAILYSPGKNLIVNVAPISSGENVDQTQTETIKVALYNGTGTTGLTQVAQTNLQSKFTNLTTVSRSNAAKSDYPKSLVIDLTGKNATLASSIASFINADVTALPEGETASTGTDILIIIGANYK